jgi:short-subunit dehydrogenase involved in D-alanine esterification of teichoic acids
MNLTGNTIFITGGGSGIGRALAEALHKRGNKVIIAGRRKGHLDFVVKANPGIEAIELDIADPDNIHAAAKKLIREHPDLNVLVNNAGIMEPDQAAGAIDDKVLLSTVTTNLLGPIRLTSALVDQLKSRRGVILYNTSVLAFVPGLDGRLLCNQSCTPLLCVVAALPPARQRCSGTRDSATLGADGVDEQPGSGAGNAPRQVYGRNSGCPWNRR